MLPLKTRWSLYRLTTLIPSESFRDEFPKPGTEEKEDSDLDSDVDSDPDVGDEPSCPKRVIGNKTASFNASIVTNSVRFHNTPSSERYVPWMKNKCFQKMLRSPNEKTFKSKE
mmetsp:Transcript_18813/g.26308  ORF Transcript_18813/g.26308 Transcript_18813/m.26308 type:complete len:113 (-) Transcript_18813:243-581(-)